MILKIISIAGYKMKCHFLRDIFILDLQKEEYVLGKFMKTVNLCFLFVQGHASKKIQHLFPGVLFKQTKKKNLLLFTVCVPHLEDILVMTEMFPLEHH